MKIETPLVPVAPRPDPSNGRPADNFAAWLNSPVLSRSDDSYYWQHQAQLQKSALQFQSTQSEITKQWATDTTEPSNLVLSAEQNTNLPMTSTGASSGLRSFLSAPEPLSVSDLEQLNSLLQTGSKQALILHDVRIMRRIDADKIAPNRSPRLIPQTSGANKSHQLFLTDLTAELSLNTSKLNREEVQDLKKIIKQWLNDKGYALTRVIINGVTL